MTPSDPRKDWIALGASALVGAVLWVPVVALSRSGFGNEGMLWYVIAYPAMVIAGFAIGRWHPVPSFLFAVVMNAASYLTALVFIPSTGELLPFEVLFMLILTIPVAFAVQWGARHAGPSR